MEKRIMVAESFLPFAPEEGRAGRLSQALRRRGVETEVVRLPRAMGQGELGQMLAARLFHLEPFCRRLIALDLLSALLPHPDKVLWLCAGPLEKPGGEVLAEYRRRAGAFALQNARRVFADPGWEDAVGDFGVPAPLWEANFPGEGPLSAGKCPPGAAGTPEDRWARTADGAPSLGSDVAVGEGCAAVGGIFPLPFPAGDAEDEAWENAVRRLLE